MKEKNPTQTITVESTTVETKVKETVPQLIDENGKTNLTLLSDAQKVKCMEITRNLNAAEVSSVSNYGVSLAQAISKSGGGLLTTKSINDETDAIINEIMSDLNKIDLSDLNERSALRKWIERMPILRNLVTTLEQKIQQYQTVQAKVDGISENINNANLRAISDNNQLQELYDNLVKYVSELDNLIIAGDYRITVEEDVLRKMVEENPNNNMAIMRQRSFVNKLEKRIDTLRSVKTLSQTQLIEIFMTQETNIAVIDNTRTLQDITMGAFANQLKIMVAQAHQRQSIQTMMKVKEGLNKAMKASAESLRENVKDMATFSNESIIEYETIDSMVDSIKDAFVTSRQIEADYHSKRQERAEKYKEIAKKFNEIGNMMDAKAQLDQDSSVSGISLTE